MHNSTAVFTVKYSTHMQSMKLACGYNRFKLLLYVFHIQLKLNVVAIKHSCGHWERQYKSQSL